MIAVRNFTPGPDKEAFHRYLTDFAAVEEDAPLLDALADCSEVIPNQYAQMLALPTGSTYRDAVQLLLSSWTTTLRAPGQHSFD